MGQYRGELGQVEPRRENELLSLDKIGERARNRFQLLPRSERLVPLPLCHVLYGAAPDPDASRATLCPSRLNCGTRRRRLRSHRRARQIARAEYHVDSPPARRRRRGPMACYGSRDRSRDATARKASLPPAGTDQTDRRLAVYPRRNRVGEWRRSWPEKFAGWMPDYSSRSPPFCHQLVTNRAQKIRRNPPEL